MGGLAMNGTLKKSNITMLAGGIFFVMICGFVAINQVKRMQFIASQKELIKNLGHELASYRHLGFTQEDTLIQTTQARIATATAQLEEMQGHRNVIFKSRAFKTVQRERIEQLLSFNKKRAESYKSQLQSSVAQGTNQEPIFAAIKEQLVSVIADMAELEMRLANKNDVMLDAVIAAKVEKIVALNRESLQFCSNELALLL